MGHVQCLVMGGRDIWLTKGNWMAHDEEPLLANPPTQDVAAHVDDYGRFTRLLKWGAITCLIVGVVWTIIIKAYW